MSARTVLLDQKSLEDEIAALSSAAQTFHLTRFERLSYQTLVVSADVTALSFVILVPILPMLFPSGTAKATVTEPSGTLAMLFRVCSVTIELAFGVGILVSTVSLLLNILLLRKTCREAKRLKRLGLATLSTSLWKESRRSTGSAEPGAHYSSSWQFYSSSPRSLSL
jgi:hypothetical protein